MTCTNNDYVVKKDIRDMYNTFSIEQITEVLNALDEKIKKSSETTITIPNNLDTSKPMWLVTDKNGASQIIMCSDKPIRKEDYWAPGNGDYVQAYVDSPFSAKFFGIFWEKAVEELRKIGLPKWEDDPVEIEVSRIKINYY